MDPFSSNFFPHPEFSRKQLQVTKMKSMLACCKLYISESRNSLALESIERAAKLYFPETQLINKFTDDAYNRVGYTLVSSLTEKAQLDDAGDMRNVVFDMVKVALTEVNLNFHSGSHPRLGVIDHICFHSLAQASLNQVAGIAKTVAADIGDKLQVPIFLYGAAHAEGRPLDSIRRELGYFKPNSSGNQWLGSSSTEHLPLQPDEGPLQIPSSKGVMVIGATGWVDNYNVPVWTTDITTVKRISRKISGRGGGLESVQAMALAHGENCIEVACNLLQPNKIGADQVQSMVERLAADEGLTAGKGYFTDFSQEKIIESYWKCRLTV